MAPTPAVAPGKQAICACVEVVCTPSHGPSRGVIWGDEQATNQGGTRCLRGYLSGALLALRVFLLKEAIKCFAAEGSVCPRPFLPARQYGAGQMVPKPGNQPSLAPRRPSVLAEWIQNCRTREALRGMFGLDLSRLSPQSADAVEAFIIVLAAFLLFLLVAFWGALKELRDNISETERDKRLRARKRNRSMLKKPGPSKGFTPREEREKGKDALGEKEGKRGKGSERKRHLYPVEELEALELDSSEDDELSPHEEEDLEEFAWEQGNLKAGVRPVWKLVRSCLEDQGCYKRVLEKGQAAFEMLS